MLNFVLQKDNAGKWSEEVASVAEIISEQNWLYADAPKYNYISRQIKDIKNCILIGGIPVGSIEFVETALKSWYDVPSLNPINIPNIINNALFCQRKCIVVNSKTAIRQLYNEWNTDNLFIKSNTKLKTDYTDIYSKKDTLPDDTSYFVSEVVDFVSEWRVFVNKNQICGLKNYDGNPWIVPNRTIVEEMVNNIGNTVKSYTLDVGVLKDGKTAVIEVHNFISCGLYGFHNKVILEMLRNGIQEEIKKVNK